MAIKQERQQKTKRLFKVLCIFLWIPVLLLSLEVYARLVHQRGVNAASRYSTNIDLRKVCEAYH